MTGKLSVVQLGIPATPANDNEYMAVFQPYCWLSSASGVGARSLIGNFYSLCTLLLITFCMLRGFSFLDLDGFRPALVFKFLMLLYSAHTCVSYFFINSIKRHSLAMFLSRWRDIRRDSKNIANIDKLKMAGKIGVSYVVMIAIVNGLFVGCGSIEFLIKFPFSQSYLFLPELAVVNGLIVFFTSFTFALSQVFYMTFCLVLMSEYHNYNKGFQQLELYQLTDQLPLLRREHRKITKLTECADSILKYYAFAVFALNVPTLLMTAFLLFRDDSMDAIARFTFVTWVGVLVMQIAIVSLVPSYLNHLAHKPLVKLEGLSNKMTAYDLHPEMYRELSLFITHITTHQIGITGGGFFVINKAMLLTLVSVMITYFAILLQLDNASKPRQCICKC